MMSDIHKVFIVEATYTNIKVFKVRNNRIIVPAPMPEGNFEKFKANNITDTSDNIYSETRYFSEMKPSNED